MYIFWNYIVLSTFLQDFMFLAQSSHMSLRKIPKFYLISWCGNFVESHGFFWENCAFPQNFHTQKLGKILVFCAVYLGENSPIPPLFAAMKTNNSMSRTVTISLAAWNLLICLIFFAFLNLLYLVLFFSLFFNIIYLTFFKQHLIFRKYVFKQTISSWISWSRQK